MNDRRAAVEHVERTGGVHLLVPPEPGYLAVVRMIVHSLVQRRELDDEGAEDVVLAVSEACSHVIDQRRTDVSGRPIALRWSETDDAFVIEVVDTSGQVDVDALPADRTVLADPTRAAMEGDLSIPLVRALVDEVTTDSGPDGSSVRMRVLCGRWEGDGA